MEFNDNRKLVDVSIITYQMNVLSEFSEPIIGKAAALAADHHFSIKGKKVARALEEERALTFHDMVPQLLSMAPEQDKTY